jgi:hypothetical protein
MQIRNRHFVFLKPRFYVDGHIERDDHLAALKYTQAFWRNGALP